MTAKKPKENNYDGSIDVLKRSQLVNNLGMA